MTYEALLEKLVAPEIWKESPLTFRETTALRQCAFIMTELEKERDQLREENRWILVTERLPKAYEKVHIWDGYALQRGHFVKQDEFGLLWHFQGNELCHYGRAASWRPLPSPPENR